MQQALNYFTALNKDYLAVHQAKEDLFWQNYMGLGGEDIAQQFSAAETIYKRFIAQSQRLKELRDLIAQLKTEPATAERDELLHGLQGWYRFFDCNAIEDPATQTLLDEIIAAESALFQRRKTFILTHLNAAGERVAASLGSY